MVAVMESMTGYQRKRFLARLVRDLVDDPVEVHHLVPRSRSIPELRDEDENVAHVPHSVHFAWHWLFANMTPAEVFMEIVRWWVPPEYLEKVAIEVSWGNEHLFWSQRLPMVHRRHLASAIELEYWFRIFPHELSYERVLLDVVTRWAPVGYFRRVQIVGKNEEVKYERR